VTRDRLFHITAAAEFAAAQQSAEYRPAAFDREGFVHCSYADQVLTTANRIFRGRHGLVLLEVDRGQLPCDVVEENLEGGAELYPHVYGPLPITAVCAVHPFDPLPDGSFSLPGALTSA
jgi:uncharacterized protein (DUF952 family)